jgi:hypothetical protein
VKGSQKRLGIVRPLFGEHSNVGGRKKHFKFFTFPSPQKNERTLESEMNGSIRRTFQRQVKENKNRKFTIFTVVQKITSP